MNSSVQVLYDWLIHRISDEDDVIIDETQEETQNIDDLSFSSSPEFLENERIFSENDMRKKESNFDNFDGTRNCRFKGEVDSEGKPFGIGTLLYSNKDSFTGSFDHSLVDRTGKFFDVSLGSSTEGVWKNGLLFGEVSIESRNGGLIQGYYKYGVPHGFQREFGVKDGQKKLLRFFGLCIRGVRHGIVWMGLLGGGYLTGKVDETGELTGSNIAYIYPDWSTVLVGSFVKGTLISGQIHSLIGSQLLNGVHQIVTVPNSQIKATYYPEKASGSSIGNFPYLRDPWEDSFVYVKNSNCEQGGEGLFAKKNIAVKSIFALYHGIRLNTSSFASCQLGHSDYRIRLNADIDLDIPHDKINLKNYCATLGHKTNHSFSAINAEWTLLEHPRFGLIRALRATCNIEENSEIYINYQMNLCDSPEWYVVLWILHQRNIKKASDESIRRIMDRYYENRGKRIYMPESLELIVPSPEGLRECNQVDNCKKELSLKFSKVQDIFDD